MVADCSSSAPGIEITEDDFGAIYFSSGTTGFPKAILHKHLSLTQAAEMEQRHHATGREDTFLCIPPLYHTGAKFHWMGSLVAGSKAVLLKGAKPETILQAVSKEHCTIVWLLVPWAQDMLDAIKRAVDLYYDKPNWRQVRKNAMSKDYSWNIPADKYIAMYKELIG